MHEVAIAQAILEQVGVELGRAKATGRVTRIEVAVGRLSGVNPDALRFALELLAPGTLLESARLDIQQPKPICCCTACGARTEIDELQTDCPACASPEITFEGGRELILQAIELDESPPPVCPDPPSVSRCR